MVGKIKNLFYQTIAEQIKLMRQAGLSDEEIERALTTNLAQPGIYWNVHWLDWY